jgi:hypothetical protein
MIDTRERHEFLCDVLTSALETPAIAYWARLCDLDGYEVKRNPNTHNGKVPGSVCLLIIEPHEGDTWPGKRRVHLTPKDVQRGIELIRRKSFEIGIETRGQILAAFAVRDAGHLDGPAVDCIVQAAVFGELVYG